MADINVIIGEQASIGKQLDRLRRNYGKAGRERKERPGYHQFKLEMLEEIFWEFQDNHQELETAIPEQDRQKHPYFSDDFHQEIQSAYQKLKDKILAGIQAAGHSASTSINEPRQTDGIKGLLNLQALTMRRLQTNLERAQASIKQGQDQQHFQVMLDAVAANWNQVFQHDEDIWKATAGATPEGYLYDEFLAMEQQVQETIASLSKQLVPDSKGQQAVSNVRTKIELPKLSLPKFDGDYLKWQEFQDLFEQMVDSAPLGRAQKMWFLKDSLVGEAARMVKHLTASDANYDAAWSSQDIRMRGKS